MSLLPEVTYVSMKNSWLVSGKEQSPEARYVRVIDALGTTDQSLRKCQKSIIIPIISVQDGIRKKKFIKSESKELWKLGRKSTVESVGEGLIFIRSLHQ